MDEVNMANVTQDPTSKPYTPIDTDRVDDIELYALDKIRVLIRFLDHSGEPAELNGLIGEVYTKDHAEYLKMTDGRNLRLDQIIEVTPHSKT
jgi:transcriptional antiterminator Rof (Rho-off)